MICRIASALLWVDILIARKLLITVFWKGQLKFREDFFHVFPDPASIVIGIIAQEVGWVISCHQFDVLCQRGGVVVMESAS